MTSNRRMRAFRSQLFKVVIGMLFTLGMTGCPEPEETTDANGDALADHIASLSEDTLPRATFDFDRGYVHIPGVGWIEADSFWQIYYAYPEQLPSLMDPEELSAFKKAFPADPALSEESGAAS